MKFIMGFVFLALSSIAFSFDDSDFDKVNWNYEVFDDGGDPGEFNHSVSKGSLSDRPKNGETLSLPLKNVECVAHVPSIHAFDLLVNRGMTCLEKGNKNFVQTAIIKCGKSRRRDVSTNYVQGIFCEAEKKCYQKSYRIVFDCAY